MCTLRLAMAQINPVVGDLEGNTAKILNYISKARSLEADIVAFPELSIPGYPPEDLLLKPQFIQQNRQYLNKIAEESKDIAIVVGFADGQDGDVYNAAAIAYGGKLIDIYHKAYLPNYGVFDEARYFKPGRHCGIYTINGINFGVNICEDIWYEVGPTNIQRAAGAQIIININGSPYHVGKQEIRNKMLSERAIVNKVAISYVNMVGGQDELVFDGGSTVVDQDGKVIIAGPQFCEELIVVDLTENELSTDLSDGGRGVKLPKGFTSPAMIHISDWGGTDKKSRIFKANWQGLDPLEEIHAALVMGTRDYVIKNTFDKVVIGLSGGIDSSLTAAIAVAALGRENVIGVAMPSRYSSEGSLSDAKRLARNLGVEFLVIPIEQAFSAYLAMLEKPLQNNESGVTEENLQARIRGNILMALSNNFGWLVLTTGNKSELATGFSTLYGDMAGGFAVIKDLSKTTVYDLARFINSAANQEMIPRSVIDKAPSAELRPNQTDEDTLPKYSIMDPVIKLYIEDDCSFNEIVAMGHNSEMVSQVIKLIDRSEYKRRQGPPGIKITPRNFGRDRRMPIVNHFDSVKNLPYSLQ